MQQNGPLGAFVACALNAAALITLLVDDRWVIRIPVLLPLLVLFGVHGHPSHYSGSPHRFRPGSSRLRSQAGRREAG